VVVVVVLVANTIYMAVNERRRELGVMRAVGFKAPHLALMVLGESAVIAVTGGVLGLLGMAAVINFTGLAVGVEGVQVSFAMTLPVVLGSLGLTIAAAVAASLLPAWQAARIDVIKAIRSGA